MVELKTPKAEPVNKSMASWKSPGRNADSVQQLKMPKLEPRGENFSSPKCVLGPNLINLTSSSSSLSSAGDESDDESGSEYGAGASSDHSDRSNSDEEYKVVSDEDEEEEDGPPRAKKPKIASERTTVKGNDEFPGTPVKKKSRVKITAKRDDSFPPKQRNSNPGRRRVGGRIYDSVLGRTCHWCRQKTVELHVECALCPIRFCGACLLNRNGEDIETEMLVRWICPKCRGGCGLGCRNCCNCGPCRKSQGLGPTGQLVNMARLVGFTNVHDYLVYQKTHESSEAIALRKNGRNWTQDSGAPLHSFLSKEHNVKEEVKEEDEVADDEKDEEKDAKNEVVEEAELYSARAKVKDEPVYVYDEPRKEKISSERRMEKISDEFRKKVSDDHRTESSDRITSSACGTSMSQSKPTNSPVQISIGKEKISSERRIEKISDEFRKKVSDDHRTESSDQITSSPCGTSVAQSKLTYSPVQISIDENPSEDIWPEKSSCDTVSHRGTSRGTQESDFARELEEALQRPFSMHQMKEMWEHVNFRKPIMKLRQTRSRAIEVPCSVDGLAYLDHYPDLETKLKEATSPEEKLRLLRGFFFWLQRSCMEGAYRPWRDAPTVDDSGDCTELSGPDCEIIRVLLAIDEDEDNAPPEWEDKKPTIRQVKKFLSPKQVPSSFPVVVKREKED